MGCSAAEGGPAAVSVRDGVGDGAAGCGAVIFSFMRWLMLLLVTTSVSSVLPGSYSVVAMWHMWGLPGVAKARFYR